MEEMSEVGSAVYLSVTGPQLTHRHHPHITQHTLCRGGGGGGGGGVCVCVGGGGGGGGGGDIPTSD